MNTVMHIPVKHPGLADSVFHKGIERIYKGAGSVSQGIGNVLWLKPLPSSWLQSRALSLLVVW